MSRPWQIKVLFFGKIHLPKSVTTPGLDLDLTYDGPYLGFLLQNGKRNVLVDTGISEKFIVDGKAWGGFPADGGSQHVLKALYDVGVSPEEIDMVIFTHLHNDHAGNNRLFTKAQFIFQKEEWRTLLDPLPVMQVRKDYDLAIIEELKEMNCLKVEGDFELADGIKIYRTPGHTPGSQSVAVQTRKGLRIMVGDHWHHLYNGFSQLTEMTDMYGKTHKITPAPKVYGPFIPASIVYNFYDWYDSGYKLRAIAGSDSPEYILPGHEPSLLIRGI